MDILSVQGLLAMLQIIVIDILLAGDNAIVIGMAVEDTLIAHSVEPYALFIKIAAVILVVGASLVAKKLKK